MKKAGTREEREKSVGPGNFEESKNLLIRGRFTVKTAKLPSAWSPNLGQETIPSNIHTVTSGTNKFPSSLFQSLVPRNTYITHLPGCKSLCLPLSHSLDPRARSLLFILPGISQRPSVSISAILSAGPIEPFSPGIASQTILSASAALPITIGPFQTLKTSLW